MESQVALSLESLTSMKQTELRELCRANGIAWCGTKVLSAESLFLKLNTGDATENPPALTGTLDVSASRLGGATDTLVQPIDGDVAPDASLAVPQEQPPAKKHRGRSPKLSASPSALTAPLPEPIPISEDEQISTSMSSSMEEVHSPAPKKPAWARFQVASGTENARAPARTPPGAKRPVATTVGTEEPGIARTPLGAKRTTVEAVRNAEPELSQSPPEAKTPIPTALQKPESVSESSLEASTTWQLKVASVLNSVASTPNASLTVETESPKTPARTPPGLLRNFLTGVKSTESALVSLSQKRKPPSSVEPTFEEDHADFYSEVRSRFRLPEFGSPDAFAELGRAARQLLDALRTGDAEQTPAKRRRLSEADRALEHVLEVVFSGSRLADCPSVPAAEGPSVPATEDHPAGPSEVLHEQVPAATPTRASGSWRSKGDLVWAHTELEQALAGVCEEGSDGTRTLTRQAVEHWLDTPAADRIRGLHLDGGCRRTVGLLANEKASPTFDFFIERALYEANICHAPLSGFRDAEVDEVQDMPKIYVAFGAFLTEESNLGPSTHKTYLEHFGKAFKFDGKAPEEMASLAYIDFVKHTWEDALHNHVMASSLSKFLSFWQQFGSRPFKGNLEASHVQFKPRSITRRLPDEGDASASALADSLPENLRAQIGDLPEGWRVHSSKGRVRAWTSPSGVWHTRKNELVRFFAAPPPPPLFYVPPPPPPERLQSLATPEKQARPEKEKMVFLPLAELLLPQPKPGEPAAAEERDRKLLPQVITTFMRMGNGRMDHREVTRKAHAMTLFKIVSESQRSFEALADPSFADLVYRSAENMKNHGTYASAMKSFREFWSDIGGYDGEFDVADREIMQRSLYIKPSLVDAPGVCGHGGISGGDFCKWSKRWCETCGTVLRCGKHEEHSREMCREVFWTKHRADGTPIRTIADFFGARSAKKAVAVASDAVSGTEQPTAN